jgi:hypothetical protein
MIAVSAFANWPFFLALGLMVLALSVGSRRHQR